jgi:hypothetical protein
LFDPAPGYFPTPALTLFRSRFRLDGKRSYKK